MRALNNTRMLYRTSKDGVRIPAIGLGTGSANTQPDIETAINAAIETGYRHIDTAYFYQNEAFIGNVLKKWWSSGKLKREDMFITTKLPCHGIHPDRVEKFLKTSLKNLQLDYVDLYLVHFPMGAEYDEKQKKFTPFSEKTDLLSVWKKMEDQVKSGRAKAIGISNFNIAQTELILKSSNIKPACNQIECHIDLQQHELVEYCQKQGIIVTAYSPLTRPGANRSDPSYNLNIFEEPTIKRIGEKHRKTPAQVLLRYLLQRGVVVIPKSITPKRIEENFNIFDFEISSEDIKALETLEAGEKARLFQFLLYPGVKEDPEYPFPK